MCYMEQKMQEQMEAAEHYVDSLAPVIDALDKIMGDHSATPQEIRDALMVIENTGPKPKACSDESPEDIDPNVPQWDREGQ